MEEETKATQVRFPIDMYNMLVSLAKKNRRSLNAEIIKCLEEYFSEIRAMVSQFPNGNLEERLEIVIKNVLEKEGLYKYSSEQKTSK